MIPPVYRNRDFAFGQTMLDLRKAIGLSQIALAQYLRITRRAISDWENGIKYPNFHNLKEFITLAVRSGAFPAGREAEEILALWQTANQKVMLEEKWLAQLLAGTRLNRPPFNDGPQRANNALSPETADKEHPRIDWGEAPDIQTFYGREQELSELRKWVINDGYRVVCVVGLGGTGKTAFVTKFMQEVASDFDVVLWRSHRNAPDCSSFLDDCFQVLAPEALYEESLSLDRRFSLLLKQLQSHRVLLVIDNFETWLEEDAANGQLQSNYENYNRLLRMVAETDHKSCLLLTGRDKPKVLTPLEGNRPQAHILRLPPLDLAACERLLSDKEVRGSHAELTRLSEFYDGNPLLLKIVAQTIVDVFNSQIEPFLSQGQLIFGGVRALLDQQFETLSTLEQRMLFWLAIKREPATLDELAEVWNKPAARLRLLETVEELYHRSLIERGEKPGSFTLQSVVLEYVGTRLITEACREIEEGRLNRLIEHSLSLTQSKEYIRQSQQRLIIAPIMNYLTGSFTGQLLLEEHILSLLKKLRSLPRSSQGYGPANLVALLSLMRGNLSGLDLSNLILRGVYWQGVEMQDSSLAGASVPDSVFTQTFDAITAVAVNAGNGFWAAASRRGEIWIWEKGGQVLYRSWLAHADMIWGLSFSHDGRTLTSASCWDGVIKQWDVASGELVWTGIHSSFIYSIAMAPDDALVAVNGGQATTLWDTREGKLVQSLTQPSTVISIAWSPDGRYIATGNLEGAIHLWESPERGLFVPGKNLSGHTKLVGSLAFSPDSAQLVSASWDGLDKIWDVASGRLLQTLPGHSNRMHRLAWSFDGSILAGSGPNNSIWLWDILKGGYRAILQGHTADLTALTFLADNVTLLSGSEDGTLRLWDAEKGQSLKILKGSIYTLFDLDWSHDGTRLACAGSDGVVTIFDVTDSNLPRLLQGHNGVVFSVEWSPDDSQLVSGAWDNTIFLWNTSSGVRKSIQSGADESFNGLTWSPDGKWLAGGTYRRGLQVFDRAGQARQLTENEFPAWIRLVSWSPNGEKLSGVDASGQIYIWSAVNGNLLHKLPGHPVTVNDLIWHPAGTYLASCGSGKEERELFVWDNESGELQFSLTDLSGSVSALAWNKQGTNLFGGDDEGRLRCWDVESKELVWEQQAHQGTIRALKSNSEGTLLASCGDDGVTRLWKLPSGEHFDTLRRNRLYERLDITGITGLSEAQKAALVVLGAVENPIL